MMGLRKLQMHAKFKITGFICYGNIREFVLNDIFAFWATLWGAKGNVRTLSVARWKARSRLSIRDNWTFSLALTVQTLQAYVGRSLHFSEGVVHSERKFYVEADVAPNHWWCKKTRVILLPHSENRVILSSFVCGTSVWRTDVQTDKIARIVHIRMKIQSQGLHCEVAKNSSFLV